MNSVSIDHLVAFLDDELRITTVPDYPNALNGLQVEHRGPVVKLAAAVDCSTKTIARAVEEKANCLLVHHGMFWNGVRPIRGPMFERLSMLFGNDIALYSCHLPLDRHPRFGNNTLLAKALDLTPAGEFAQFRGTSIGVWGEEASLRTAVLTERATEFARRYGGDVRAISTSPQRLTRRWAMCTGSGASSETITEALALGVDTLIVGEGPHHTAVEGDELGICIIYAGHYATETLGIQAITQHLADQYDLPWIFIHHPTGL